jgi:radical SAM superfamily enzyme YgiQ (UPF0313 family)
MARILLIKCSEYDTYPFAMSPPMGLMYLSASLKRDGGHRVKILDTRLGLLTAEQVARKARAFKPDIIGLGAILLESRCFHEYAAALHRALPGVSIVAGGPYASTDPDAVLKDPAVACAVLGEGEATITDLARAMECNDPWKHLPGLALRGNGALTINPQREYIRDLDALPFPDWDAADLAGYARAHRFSNLAPGPYMTVFTSRSCPYHCIYCHSFFGKSFRARSPESVFEEIRTLHDRYGIRDIEILDDCFNLDRARALEICERIARSRMKLRLSFPNGVRSDRLDPELIAMLKAAGTCYMAVAIETASPRLQKYIRKNLDLDKARDAMGRTVAAGIFCHGYFMLGFPTETRREMQQTIDFAATSPLHTASFFVVKAVPGTELHQIARNGTRYKKANNSKEFAYTSLNYSCSELGRGTLQLMYRRAYRQFYSKPERMVRIAADFPDKWHLASSLLHLGARITGFQPNGKNVKHKTRAVNKA